MKRKLELIPTLKKTNKLMSRKSSSQCKIKFYSGTCQNTDELQVLPCHWICSVSHSASDSLFGSLGLHASDIASLPRSLSLPPASPSLSLWFYHSLLVFLFLFLYLSPSLPSLSLSLCLRLPLI